MGTPAQPPVSELFRTAITRAEWAIALLRLGMSSALAVLLVLLLGGSGIDPTEMMQRQAAFAMVTMASYFLLGLGFVVLIRTGVFRTWMAWPSALVDCSFILAGVWVSLQNLDLSGHYIWAFPTVWLIPIVLASGALRFNPVLQVVMVLLLVTGLLIMLPITDAARETDTLSPLEFLFGLPPNLMRLAMLLIAGLVLVFASVLIRRLLWRFIAESEVRGRLTRFLPEQLEDRLATSDIEALRTGAAQQMGIMFVDIRGFTALSEGLPPEEVSTFLTGFRRCVSAAAEAHHGLVDKFIGDGALIVFDDAQGGAADNAIAAAQTLLAQVNAWRRDVHVGVGLHLGQVFAGVVGDDGRLEFTVVGDAVNVASRLEAATKGSGHAVFASDTLWQSVSHPPAGWSKVDALALPGRAETVAAWGRA
ncbi:adenylate/guanylate cyclase domain-containing protein [uncultured Tateyamaria sp.]|uniref:adenylate/guanylate cyclase domain-containing protein n=1 Tax=Tateyamaria sp. 1078 TaxID=3417464 RepID=UPI002618B233|nr:adenylate/guanylate cyclase domain-containing protein [uncultured Tateyamaria sp.]